MTAPVEAEDASEQRPPGGPHAPDGPDPRPRPTTAARDAVSGICPYLTASGGSWRMSAPSRDHRCGAVDPPAPQSTDKQRRHCLADEHVECPTFRAARDARTALLAAGADPALVQAADLRRRPLARTAPVLLEPPRLVDQAVRLQFERGPGQIALIGLMIVAFAIVALTRLSVGGAAVAPSLEPSQQIAAASPTPSPTPTATPSPSVSPSSSAAPSPRALYTVRKGDTLVTIAKKYATTAAKIKAFNGLTTSTLKVGQVLKIP